MRRLLLALLLVPLLAGCAAPTAGTTGGDAVREPAPPAPTSVRIPQLQVRSTLIETGLLPSGAPQVPPVTEPAQASWGTFSPEPGSIGPAVLYGHVDGQVDGRRGVPGVFHDIDQLQPGNAILVDRADGTTVEFAVTRVATYPKLDFADQTSTATAEVYGDTAAAELRLITCGGSFDPSARSYRDQVVVFAVAVPTP